MSIFDQSKENMFFALQSSKTSRKPSKDEAASEDDEGQSPRSEDSSEKNIISQSLKCLEDEDEEDDNGYDLYGGFKKKALTAVNGKHVSPPTLMNGGNSHNQSGYFGNHIKSNGLHHTNSGDQIDRKTVTD